MLAIKRSEKLDSAIDARRLIATFLALTLALSLPSYWLAVSGGTLGILSVSLMWAPGVAAMLTMIIHRRSLRELGWRLGKVKYLLVAYLLPLGYSAVVYVPTWALVQGAFDPVLPAAASAAPSIGTYVAIMATLGILQSLITAVGEEIGWRGLLVPQLARVTSFRNSALISGVIWVLWHSPVLLFADYNAGAPPLFSLTCFAVMVVGLSFAFAWLRLVSGSLWPAALLHASHNLFVQGIFDVMTGQTDSTIYITGEFGVGLMLAGVVVGYVFWRLWSRDHSVAETS